MNLLHKEVKKDNTLLYSLIGVIAVLVIALVAVGSYALGKSGSNPTGIATAEWAEVIVIDDARCSDCQTDEIVSSLEGTALAGADLTRLDFSDSEAQDILQATGVTRLPAIIIDERVGDANFQQYLVATDDGRFSLNLGSTFDPYAERSDRGLLLVPEATLEKVQANAYIEWNENGNILWVEYTDVNCSFCQKMEKDGTAQTLFASYPEVLKKTTSNYIGVGGVASENAAKMLECVGRLGGAEAYNTALSQSLSTAASTPSDILGYVSVDNDAAQSCYDNNETQEIVDAKFATGRDDFGITGTPGNILINLETKEFVHVNGAAPVANFESAINQLR